MKQKELKSVITEVIKDLMSEIAFASPEPRFTNTDLKAMLNDAKRWIGITFTREQIADLLLKNPDYAKQIWDDFEQVGHPDGGGMDTAVRDIWFDLIGTAYAGSTWPLGATGPRITKRFFDKLYKGLDKAHIPYEKEETVNESSPPDFPEKIKKKILKQYGDTSKAYATMWAIHNKKNEGDKRVTEMWAAFENKKMKEGLGDWGGWGKETPQQQASVKRLERGGFKYTHHFPMDGQDDPEEKMCIVMQRKKGPRTISGEVDADGSVNGKSVEDFIKWLNDSGAGISEHDESDMSNPEERKEVDIGNEMVGLAKKLLAIHKKKVNELGGQITSFKNSPMLEAGVVWDVDEMPVQLNGHTYFVSARFEWGDRSVDHRFDQGKGQGQDLIAEVPLSIESIQAIEETDKGPVNITDKEYLDQLGQLALEKFKDSDKGERNKRWGNWM